MGKLLKLDWVLIIAALLLAATGILALYSISMSGGAAGSTYLKKQIVSLSIGAVLMFFFAFYDYRILNLHSTKLYFLALVVLAGVLLLGTTIRGTTGWIGLGKFHIQPVEIVKIVMIIFLASFLSKKKTELSNFVRVAASVVLVGIPVFFILKQPDFGSSAIIIGTWISMLMVSGIHKKNIFILAIFFAGAVFLGSFFMKDYQKDRLVNFVNPYNDPRGSGYNVIQSIVAVGSGGLWGKGLGHGSQSQLNFLPEKHTDFIFAVIAEEMGLLGASVVLILFSFLLYRMKEIARSARDNFGYLLAVGIISMLFCQTLVNVGMNVGLVPVAGVPLPLVSYGGSSLVVIMTSIGIAESIYRKKIKTID